MNNLLEIFAAAAGIAYLLLEYRANAWLWLFSILMAGSYIWIFFSEGIYANGCLNVYYLLISIYGAWRWMKKPDWEEEEGSILSMPKRMLPLVLAAIALLTAGLWKTLSLLGESETAFLDAFTSALSVVGMWMLTKKYYQQWICWIVVEPIMTLMSLRAGLYPTAVMYLFYSVISVMGYLRWKKNANKKERFR